VNRSNNVRLVRDAVQAAPQAAPNIKNIPSQMPSIPPPRGSLLNLSV
jgi:hypothetical protein